MEDGFEEDAAMVGGMVHGNEWQVSEGKGGQGADPGRDGSIGQGVDGRTDAGYVAACARGSFFTDHFTGKFQLTVIAEAGHFIQEDVPEKMAQLAVEFFKRNDRSTMVLPPKVSDLIAQGKKV